MHIMTKDGWKPLACKSIPAPHDKTLLELLGLGKRTNKAADRYMEAIDRYLLPRDHPDHITEEKCFAIMGDRGNR